MGIRAEQNVIIEAESAGGHNAQDVFTIPGA
jgi:hypothetical protein